VLRLAGVAGGLEFDRLSVAFDHTCGETRGNLAYCWGFNYSGQLGDGTTLTRLTPVAVKGGHIFRQLDVGYGHACGIATTGVAYCWGRNNSGQLGDGTNTDRLKPVPISGTM
jgi:alpha-tubulin suppressor-like RCC1 family protein